MCVRVCLLQRSIVLSTLQLRKASVTVTHPDLFPSIEKPFQRLRTARVARLPPVLSLRPWFLLTHPRTYSGPVTTSGGPVLGVVPGPVDGGLSPESRFFSGPPPGEPLGPLCPKWRDRVQDRPRSTLRLGSRRDYLRSISFPSLVPHPEDWSEVSFEETRTLVVVCFGDFGVT